MDDTLDPSKEKILIAWKSFLDLIFLNEKNIFVAVFKFINVLFLGFTFRTERKQFGF